MLVGDIYGDRDYTSIGLSATTIASSFGRIVSEDLDLQDVQPADVAMALCRSLLPPPLPRSPPPPIPHHLFLLSDILVIDERAEAIRRSPFQMFHSKLGRKAGFVSTSV